MVEPLYMKAKCYNRYAMFANHPHPHLQWLFAAWSHKKCSFCFNQAGLPSNPLQVLPWQQIKGQLEAGGTHLRKSATTLATPYECNLVSSQVGLLISFFRSHRRLAPTRWCPAFCMMYPSSGTSASCSKPSM